MGNPSDNRDRGSASQPSESTAHSLEISRLFREHNRALVLFLAARLKNEQAAREVAQEAYVKLLQLEAPGAVSFLRAYLFKVAANLAVDRLRQERTRARIDQKDSADDFTEESLAERSAEARDELESLRRFIGELPPRYGQAFHLHAFEEMAFEDVAKAMKIRQRMARHYVTLALVYVRLRREGSSARQAWNRIQAL